MRYHAPFAIAWVGGQTIGPPGESLYADLGRYVTMNDNIEKETVGAWIIHHGRKIAMDAYGASEFPVMDEAAKAANLLTRLGESNDTKLTESEVVAVAKVCRLNPRVELEPLLKILEDRRLIERKDDFINVLGITTHGALIHATSIFSDSKPSNIEIASIELAEKTSNTPLPEGKAAEYISDTCKMTTKDTKDFISRSKYIGFIDSEGQENDCLLFNGNLFRRNSISKTHDILSSLSSSEQTKVREFKDIMDMRGCANVNEGKQILGENLFKKLVAAGVFDLNTVSNDRGEHIFITAPDSFHKFVDPMVDDCFDMAKALVSAFTYGMTIRDPSQGRIHSISDLLKKLIRGNTIGSATAIGMDYRILEQNRVVHITPNNGLFDMKLLKKEIGTLALEVLTRGDANFTTIDHLPEAPMTNYIGPEDGRVRIRKQQNTPSKRATQDILNALRGGRDI